MNTQEFGWRHSWRICDYPGEQVRILDILRGWRSEFILVVIVFVSMLAKFKTQKVCWHPFAAVILREKHGDSPDTSVIRCGRLGVRNYYIVSTVLRVAQSV